VNTPAFAIAEENLSQLNELMHHQQLGMRMQQP
jgi:hypothetical protein